MSNSINLIINFACREAAVENETLFKATNIGTALFDSATIVALVAVATLAILQVGHLTTMTHQTAYILYGTAGGFIVFDLAALVISKAAESCSETQEMEEESSQEAVNESSSEAVFQIKSLNLGDDGHVKWNGRDLFANLFDRTKEFNKALPKHEMLNPPQQNRPLEEDFKDGEVLGRSIYNPTIGMTQKTRNPHENKEEFGKEARAQAYLGSKKEEWGLRSTLPSPIHWDEDILYYQTPQGYHTYLTDIDAAEPFEASLEICAHDLGCLLRQGIAYPALISIFHEDAENKGLHIKEVKSIARIYTAFPSFLGHQSIWKYEDGKEEFGPKDGGLSKYGAFPGEIEHICDPNYHLYPNLGLTGLRDLGDYVTIDEFVASMQEVNQKHTTDCEKPGFAKKLCTQSIAIAHFLSLYQIILMLIIAKRAQRMNRWDQEGLQKSFTVACHTLLTAFLQLDDNQSSEMKSRIEQGVDWERFMLQMRFCFTTEDRDAIFKHEWTCKVLDVFNKRQRNVTITSYLPSEREIKRIWGDQVVWGQNSMRGHVTKSTYTTKNGFAKGNLGNDSAPNPLVEGMQAILNFSYYGTQKWVGS